jgi:protein TonB
MGVPSRREAFFRGLESVERRGGATIYKVVFGQPRPRPPVPVRPIRFDGVEPELGADGEGRLGWAVAIAAHAALIGLALSFGIPEPARDPIPDSGMMVEFISEEGAAAGRRPDMLPPAAPEPQASTGEGEMAGAAMLEMPGKAGDGEMPVGAEQRAGGSPASPALVPVASPMRQALPLPAAPAKSAGSVSLEEAAWEGAIVQRIDKKKRYPRTAKSSRLEDKVMLRIAIDREGRLIRSEIARSKGHRALDAEAVELARRSSPYPRPPASVVGETVSVVVPVEFKLKTGT